ncbi:MAG: hypothetical protein HQK51_02810 [Oligoflexia bacterium]|nr:hypothetical protein [Oligoflexia bacterium]
MHILKTSIINLITLIQFAIFALFIIINLLVLVTSSSSQASIFSSFDSSDSSSSHNSISKDSWLTSLSVGIHNPYNSTETGTSTINEHDYSYTARLQTDIPVFHTIHLHGEMSAFTPIENPKLSEYKSREQNSYRGLIGYIFEDISPKWNFIPRAGVFVPKKGELKNKNIQVGYLQISPLWYYQRDNGNIINISMNYTHLNTSKKTPELPGLHDEWAVGIEGGEIIPKNRDSYFAFNYSAICNLYNYYRIPDNIFVKRIELMLLLGVTF